MLNIAKYCNEYVCLSVCLSVCSCLSCVTRIESHAAELHQIVCACCLGSRDPDHAHQLVWSLCDYASSKFDWLMDYAGVCVCVCARRRSHTRRRESSRSFWRATRQSASPVSSCDSARTSSFQTSAQHSVCPPNHPVTGGTSNPSPIHSLLTWF